PLYGAVVLAIGDWRAIFWVNCAIGLVLVAAILPLRDAVRESTAGRRFDWLGAALAVLALTGMSLVMVAPTRLVQDIDIGRAYLPVTGDSRWMTPLALATFGLTALLLLRIATARNPLVAWRTWPALARETDLWGALLLTLGLGAVIVTFASAEPESGAVSPDAPWLVPIALVAFVGFAVRQRRAVEPLIPRGALSARPAWGAIVVSFFVGAALIAALVDIPFFARLTVHRDSQLDAALVLVKFLVALPVGALIGGWLLRRVPAHVLTAVAMVMSALAFWHMSTWDATALDHQVETLSLVLGGLGFGLAIAPVNAVLLSHTADAVHGVSSALLIVARMVGMLLGISALTTIGLRAFYDASDRIAPVAELCPGKATLCKAYKDAVLDAGITQLHAVFVGAAVCAVIAAVLALVLLRPTADATPEPAA
ncbi:MAG: MFS transporter, partial [Aeromicrobium sp.]